ncbi:hypothetical protein NDU88_004968 [Pleurodeles waltl]|uniref:Uncharacterized protein n=1 Tax=Pleurodeles waltl TaxID=8319 RepID=A0AAV7SKG0_PLEWA|nr:hypothetical protein NDU88_004968 [Pleurodeles waltl]
MLRVFFTNGLQPSPFPVSPDLPLQRSNSNGKVASRTPAWELQCSRHNAMRRYASDVSRPTESSRHSPLTGRNVPYYIKKNGG